MGPNEASIFLPEVKLVHIDAYGGEGRGGNLGSGRTATLFDQLMVQLKGLGKTVHATRQHADHSNGILSSSEAIREAIWSVITNRESDIGANDVLFAMDRGSTTKTSQGVDSDFIVVRKIPLHIFFLNGHLSK